MVVCCGMAVSVRKVQALTVNMETVTLIGKGRYNLTCFMNVYESNSEIFFRRRCFIFVESS